MTANIKKAVAEQSEDALFKNWRGVMVGSGELWFTAVNRENGGIFELKVIGINP